MTAMLLKYINLVSSGLIKFMMQFELNDTWFLLSCLKLSTEELNMFITFSSHPTRRAAALKLKVSHKNKLYTPFLF